MRILHAIAGVWSESGGLGELVIRFAQEESLAENEVSLVFLEGNRHSQLSRAIDAGVKVSVFNRSFPNFAFFSWEMFWKLGDLIRKADVVHIHSNWTFPVWWSGILALWYRKKYVMSPQGCYDPVRMRHSAWKKKLVGWMDRSLARRANVIHVTSKAERGWVENFLNENKDNKQTVRTRPNIVLVPNGIETPVSDKGQAVNKGYDSSQCTRTVLYMGRLHPLKGLDLLLEAWAKIVHGSNTVNKANQPISQTSRQLACWRLLIVGPDEQGTKNTLLKQVEAFGLENHVAFMGLMQGDEKWDVLRQADIFVLPSRSENFGIVVGEALACGIPVVMTDVGPWEEMAATHAWQGRLPFAFVETTPPAIVDGLLQMMTLDDEERKQCGLEGKTWVAEQFGWKTVAGKMLAVYENMLEGKN